MPRVFDNITLPLLPALRDALKVSYRADFSVGYLNLRGWSQIDELVEQWEGGEGNCCRVIVGMQRPPHQDLRDALNPLKRSGGRMDQSTALRLKKAMAEQFREQLALGTPNNDDEAGLRRLAHQLRSGKVIVKLYLRHTLHAKLYLAHRHDPINPTVGFVGSSNLTFSGLSWQGELNVDVLDHDACEKLGGWFEERWRDRLCLDISEELADIIEESWAREDLISPYHAYLKIAYHLSQEARAGLSEFRIPKEFGDELFEFQTAAVKIAAHHLNKRGGALIGDVVGLGKTLMATTLARIFQDDYSLETLIICPKNLVGMWEEYRDRYRLIGRVLPISRVQTDLPNMRRHRLVIVDESHNLRNTEGKRYRAIREYIAENESRAILLSATPYNKSYEDLSAQLGLFIPREEDLGIRPERMLSAIGGEAEFVRKHQAPLRSLAAFEQSEHADDWRELMRLYLVRRTRRFIKENYAQTDEDGRKYLTMADGTRNHFPERIPKTCRLTMGGQNSSGEAGRDPYAALYSPAVVDVIDSLKLPRYGLGNYLTVEPPQKAQTPEEITMRGLSRAGRRLMGFCRTGLFKRLESSGPAFLQSVERHVLRNFVFIHALEGDLPVPVGTQESELIRGQAALDSQISDEDPELLAEQTDEEDGEPAVDGRREGGPEGSPQPSADENAYRARAETIYEEYRKARGSAFKWLPTGLFGPDLLADLLADARALLSVLEEFGDWDPGQDAKLAELERLLTETHPGQKVIVFSQFADTVDYVSGQLEEREVDRIAGVTGGSENPTALAHLFSPVSNDKRDEIPPSEELRVLVSTDVLSEGQNLQDCAIVVNFDLPWAIIQLIQRAGRVDRIGQRSPEIFCYSFMPAEGVEQIINLRDRVKRRLKENDEVIGADEAFFEDEAGGGVLRALYNEKAGVLDGEDDSEVDLASQAYQIYKNATDEDPRLRKIVSDLPDVVYATRGHKGSSASPEGVLLYVRTQHGNDALSWVDREGNSVTESQLRILEMARCGPNEPAFERHPEHHDLVARGMEHIVAEQRSAGGQLGRPSGARFRTYERLKRHAEEVRGTVFESEELFRAIDDIFRHPLRQSATDTLNRQLRSGIDDQTLADLVLALRDEDRLCVVHDEEEEREPRIICSMGLFDSADSREERR